jgi:hypothetical protein
MHNKIAFALLLITTCLISSCYYDNEEELYGTDGNCDVSSVKFSTDIQGIFNNACLGCHSAQANLGNVNLSDHANTIKYVNNGSLLGSVKHDSGFSPMPKGSPKISSCNIAKIEAWIAAGAPNN